MIDYKKLKVTHSLAQKYSKKIDCTVQISIDFDPEYDEFYDKKYAQCRLISNFYCQSFYCIDDLIIRLKELLND